MNIYPTTVIGELVAEDYRTASIFKSFGIDFCCNGNRNIADACIKKNIEVQEVISALQTAIAQQVTGNTDYNTWPLDLLADYIEKTHHRYVRSKIIEIMPFLNKVVRVHGENHPELKEVEQLFKDSAVDLSEHMLKEEKILFPFIRKMVTEGSGTSSFAFGTVQNPIAMMKHEHENEGDRFRKIAALTNDYTPPADACNTYRVTFSLLKEFEENLHLHIHLENNILFPKAIELEQPPLACALR